MKQFLKKFIDDTSGTTAVEFGLIAMSFLTVIFGIFEGGRLIMMQNSFQYSLERATRQALVNDDITEDELAEYIADDMAVMMLDPDKINMEIGFAESSGVDFVEISGTYNFSPMISYFLPDNWSSINLAASSRMPVIECSIENCPWNSEPVEVEEDDDGAGGNDGGGGDDGAGGDDGGNGNGYGNGNGNGKK
ncbi:MAG: pilus assembly protein [Proteobacteria bacterium]|nr:pilus assembly protein [Pseudomonadota bacterium]